MRKTEREREGERERERERERSTLEYETKALLRGKIKKRIKIK